MARRNLGGLCALVVLGAGGALAAGAQSFQVQCPTSTITHPAGANNLEPSYVGPTVFAAGPSGYMTPTSKVNGAIKCSRSLAVMGSRQWGMVRRRICLRSGLCLDWPTSRMVSPVQSHQMSSTRRLPVRQFPETRQRPTARIPRPTRRALWAPSPITALSDKCRMRIAWRI